tara:strand:+ start:4678 stop:5613 length:936 start_codon:yes stop_codon:yes gene_type:complete
MLFNNFPTVEYRFKNLRTVSILDIFRSVKFTKKTLNSTVAFDTYTISDGDTPESISEQVYGDPLLFWVILMSNDIIDINKEWPRFTAQETAKASELYSGFSFFFDETTEIKKGDMIVKRDTSSDGNVSDQYGVVSTYIESLNKADVINNTFSSLTTGSSATVSLDNYFVVRKLDAGRFSRILDNVQPKRIDPLLDSPAYFKKSGIVLNPKLPLTSPASFSETADPSYDARITGSRTILKRYVSDEFSFLNDAGIKRVRVRDELPDIGSETSFNRLIKVLKPQYVSDVVSEVVKLINGPTTGSSTLTYLGSY